MGQGNHKCPECGVKLIEYGGCIGVVTPDEITVKTVFFCENKECPNRNRLTFIDEVTTERERPPDGFVPGAERLFTDCWARISLVFTLNFIATTF